MIEEPDDYDPIQDTFKQSSRFLGRFYQFEDGDKIEVVQVKRRDDGPWVTYHIYQGPGIPRKLTMTAQEFDDLYGHLFE